MNTQSTFGRNAVFPPPGAAHGRYADASGAGEVRRPVTPDQAIRDIDFNLCHAPEFATSKGAAQEQNLQSANCTILTMLHDCGMQETPAIIVGKRIREARRRLGFSQEKLAELWGYSGASDISNIETGKRRPGMEKLMDLSQIFGGLPLDFFLNPDDERAEMMLALSILPRDQVTALIALVRSMRRVLTDQGVPKPKN